MKTDKNTPGQGHTPKQYEDSMKIFCYAAIVFAVVIVCSIVQSLVFSLIN